MIKLVPGDLTLLQVWLFNVAMGAGRYLAVALLFFLVVWVFGKERFKRRRIAARAPKLRHLAREVKYSLLTACVFAVGGVVTYLGHRGGVLRVYEDVSQHGVPYLLASVVLLIVLHDTYFYWTHRMMHSRWLYKSFHRAHHLSTNPSPWAAYAFAPGEAMVHSAFVPLAALFVPINPLALFLWLLFMITRNVWGHLGFELLGRGFIRHPVGRHITTTTHHHMHHQHFRSNYGLYFTWWDDLMGTTHPEYADTFERIASAPRVSRRPTRVS